MEREMELKEIAKKIAKENTNDTMEAAREYAEQHLLDQETMTIREMLEVAFLFGSLYSLTRTEELALGLGIILPLDSDQVN